MRPSPFSPVPISPISSRAHTLFHLFAVLEALGDVQTAVQTAIARENFPIPAHGDGAYQYVNRANLEALTPALVVQAGSILMISSLDLFIEKWSESRLDFFELRLLFDPRQYLLPYQSYYGDAAVMDRLRQFALEFLLLGAEDRSNFPAQR